ncbi:integrase core domain-containing protein [Noviherbaspirillum humi]|uniref:integrase core domain-containing protein n=1 Tax=Noviherbaspirillum humi TaxID=1688639 RepID=UPI003CCB7D30
MAPDLDGRRPAQVKGESFPQTHARTVMQQLDTWFEHYNTRHPHSALSYLPPRRLRQRQALNN